MPMHGTHNEEQHLARLVWPPTFWCLTLRLTQNETAEAEIMVVIHDPKECIHCTILMDGCKSCALHACVGLFGY